MIFSLTDETYSVLCSVDTAEYIPAGVNKYTAMFFIALFNQLYWITGCVLGCWIGSLLNQFDFTGIDFSMTALFTVLFVEQWKTYASHLPAILGLVCATVFLLILGPDSFLLPSLAVTVALLVIFRKQCDPQNELSTEDK